MKDIIIRPLITEKMTAITERFPNRYGFIVARHATKAQVKAAIEALYDVEVVEVNTMRYAGKKRRRWTKTGVIEGKSPAFKKAIVTLKENQVIDFYSNI